MCEGEAPVLTEWCEEDEGAQEPELLARCFAAAVKDAEVDKQHRRCGHHPSQPECEVCRLADSRGRIHRHVPEDEKSRGVLALGLTGPHTAAEGGWRW